MSSKINVTDSFDTSTSVSSNGNEIVETVGGVIPKNQCTAWVVFDGTDGTIKDSYNISSVVRDAVGKYTITFNTQMQNTNYIPVGSAEKWDTNDDGNICVQTLGCSTSNHPTVSEFHVVTVQGQSTDLRDCANVVVVLFGVNNMKTFYKINTDGTPVIGSGTVIPKGFTEYKKGSEPQELLDAIANEELAKRPQEINNAIQQHLDSQAQALRYDNMMSARSYAGYANPFQAEATALATWASDCWVKAGQIEADVKAGTIAMPTVDEAIAMLPVYGGVK